MKTKNDVKNNDVTKNNHDANDTIANEKLHDDEMQRDINDRVTRRRTRIDVNSTLHEMNYNARTIFNDDKHITIKHIASKLNVDAKTIRRIIRNHRSKFAKSLSTTRYIFNKNDLQLICDTFDSLY